MVRFKQFEVMGIMEFEKEFFDLPEHGQNYFELMYILEGGGVHSLNDRKLSYGKGSLFLVSPMDHHIFTILEKTSFFAIKFTESYFEFWERRGFQGISTYMERILTDRSIRETSIEFSLQSKQALMRIVENIKEYQPREDVPTSLFVWQQFLSIFALVIEKKGYAMEGLSMTPVGSQELLSYIHRNIYHPERLRTKEMAKIFNRAESYFSLYFKRNFDMGLKQYIDAVRFPLIRRRIESKNFTMKEIAKEFGFTDASHLFVFYNRMIQADKAGHIRNLS
ncbi:AraC family transcriptional regulator [Sphingobacterium sp. LRF_L2]|uniref:AraC family transcriptional regulator n=1 Tax=Sphingobacterium sp. LRF_L2 TaxID=3369421 RepID=UPI003F61ADD2